MANLNDLYTAILTGKLPVAVAITKEAIEENVDPQYVINEYMVKAMEEIGSRFEAGRAFVPELLMAARAMKGSLELLKPQLAGNHSRPIAKIIIGTVKGDLHDIGKNLVVMMMKGAGFEIVDLGTDVPAETFVDKAEEIGADVIGMSALLTTTMPNMKDILDVLKERGLRDKYIVMAGGAPVNQAFVDQIGADYYTEDAASAAEVAKEAVIKRKAS